MSEIFSKFTYDDTEYVVKDAAARTGLDNKVDKVAGKGLSTEDYTTAEKTKLAGIAAGAEVNVQADWNQADSSADDYIKNKPSVTGAVWGSVTGTLSDQTDLINALDNKADNSTVGSIATAVSNHIGNTTVHVTANDKTNWNGKITNPSGGTAGQVLTKTASGETWQTPVSTAADVSYDNTDSGLTATDVQDAIDETVSALNTGLSSAVKSVNTEIPDANGNVDITKTNIGLGNVDNTSDLDKPISTATQTALANQKYFYIDSEGYGCINYDLFQTS